VDFKIIKWIWVLIYFIRMSYFILP
jgi:hypothetical protein